MRNYFWKHHTLNFRRPAGTSRGALTSKPSWFICYSEAEWDALAIGEVSIIPGLSIDPESEMEATLDEVCEALNHAAPLPDLHRFPSIRFALETLTLDIKAGGSKKLYPSAFTTGNQAIRINGLIWMGTFDFMRAQVIEKVEQGFRCIKLKIGAKNFEDELNFIAWIRSNFSDKDLELRVDANGAFHPHEALTKLEALSKYDLHSIEQPIKPGQFETMAALCDQSPLATALDEELIGYDGDKFQLLETIKPQYIILKPSLIGGLAATDAWIEAAEKQDIGWWMTSALESNIGLNAITQYAYSKAVKMPQGLGTGSLYSNNVNSPLFIKSEYIHFNPNAQWDLSKVVS